MIIMVRHGLVLMVAFRFLTAASWKTYTEKNSGISSSVVFSIAIDDNDEIWFGTYAGVSSFDGKSWKVYSARTQYNVLEERCVYAIDIDEKGNKWFGTTTGMWQFDGDSWTSFTGHESNLQNDVYVRAILTDSQGETWIGSSKALTLCDTKTEPILKKSAVPTQMTITGNYPNPFNPSTTVEFIISEGGNVKLEVYNITGQKVRSLLSDTMAPGKHTVVWDGRNDAGMDVSSGVYLFRLKMQTTDMTHRMMLVR